MGSIGNAVDITYEAQRHTHTDPYMNNYRNDFFEHGLIPFYTLVQNRVYDAYRPDFDCL